MQKISISIVSHLQCSLVGKLLADIERCCKAIPIEVILTHNMHEEPAFDTRSFSFPLKTIRNPAPQGFSANHNQAFMHATGNFFCVMNPDIRLYKDPFPALLACLENPFVGVAAPIIVGATGELEDSARHFPTPFRILCKVFGIGKGIDYVVKDETLFPDWVGGMFMLFPSGIFRGIGGFNTDFFLYYEDVDLCARLTLRGYRVAVCHEVPVIHEARRASHANLRHLWWHVKSALRFFLSPVYRQLRHIRK